MVTEKKVKGNSMNCEESWGREKWCQVHEKSELTSLCRMCVDKNTTENSIDVYNKYVTINQEIMANIPKILGNIWTSSYMKLKIH